MKKENTRLLWYNVFNGLKKSGHAFNKKFNGVLKAVGFKRSSFDPCFYFLRDKEELFDCCDSRGRVSLCRRGRKN